MKKTNEAFVWNYRDDEKRDSIRAFAWQRANRVRLAEALKVKTPERKAA